MILNNEVKVNCATSKTQRESKAVKDNQRENKRRIQHIYKERSKSWIVKSKYESSHKPDNVAEGPFLILKVYGIGTLKIDRVGYSEVIHIRRLKPYIK